MTIATAIRGSVTIPTEKHVTWHHRVSRGYSVTEGVSSERNQSGNVEIPEYLVTQLTSASDGGIQQATHDLVEHFLQFCLMEEWTLPNLVTVSNSGDVWLVYNSGNFRITLGVSDSGVLYWGGSKACSSEKKKKIVGEGNYAKGDQLPDKLAALLDEMSTSTG